MQHAEKLERVRRLVHETFRTRGTPQDECPIETILVREGYYCGRRFACAGLRAVWFVEENVIKVFGSQGEFLEATRVSEAPDELLRKAA